MSRKGLNKITLEGRLAKKFGGEFYFDVNSVAEAFRALCSQLKGFRQEYDRGAYQVFRKFGMKKYLITQESSALCLGDDEIIISPAIAGGGVDITPIIEILPGGTLITRGSQELSEYFLSPMLDAVAGAYSSRGRPDQKPSFIYNGPVNTAEQGLPVPLVYGTMRVGSVVVSAGIVAEEI